jgi:DNA-directed RNA polymerase specialized sigma24 family protein
MMMRATFRSTTTTGAREMRQLKDVRDAGQPEPWEASFAAERRAAVHGCLATLPERLRVLIECRFGIAGHGELTVNEIARLYALHPDYVRSRISKGLAAIAKNRLRTKMLKPYADPTMGV